MRIVLAAAAGFEILISLIGLISERALGFLIYFQPHVAVVVAEESFLGTRRLGWSSLVIGTLLIAAVPVIGRSKKVAIVYVVGQSLYAAGRSVAVRRDGGVGVSLDCGCGYVRCSRTLPPRSDHPGTGSAGVRRFPGGNRRAAHRSSERSGRRQGS
jgi:hypothetical protein